MTDHITIGRTPPFVKDSSHPAPDAGMSRIPTITPTDLAADPTLAADLALAAAVRDAEDTWHYEVEYDRRGGGRYWVTLAPAFDSQPKRRGRGPTLTAAIEEALRDATGDVSYPRHDERERTSTDTSGG